MTAAHRLDSLLLARATVPYSASGWADGLTGAPRGLPQHPGLLARYGNRRPPWNVAGVDYHVGVPDDAKLMDWATLANTAIGSGVNLATGLIRTDNVKTFTFKNIDFSRGMGATLRNVSGAATSLTFLNCKFGVQPNSQQAQNPTGTYIYEQNNAQLTVQNCSFDGLNMQTMSGFIVCNGSLTMEYNYFTRSTFDIVSIETGSWSPTVVYKYNFIDDGVQGHLAHKNYIQWDITSQTAFATVTFNTTYQYSPPIDFSTFIGEGFQWYTNNTGGNFTNPIFSNNTMIARPGRRNANGDTSTISSMVHGAETGTGTTTGGQNNNNYFDHSGAYSAYYAGKMIPSVGWSSSGNIDMNTGASITPT